MKYVFILLVSTALIACKKTIITDESTPVTIARSVGNDPQLVQISLGNIYEGGQLKFRLINAEKVGYIVIDAWGNIVKNTENETPKNKDLDGNNQFYTGITTPGYYEIHIQPKDGANNPLPTVGDSLKTVSAIISPYNFTDNPNLSPFSIQTHFAYGWEDYTSLADLVKLMGATSVRDQQTWTEIENGIGQYDFTTLGNRFTNYMQALEDKGINTLVSFGLKNNLYDSGKIPYTDNGINAISNFAKATVNYYKNVQPTNPGIVIGGINEYNIAQENIMTNDNNPIGYYPIQKKMYSVVHNAFPGFKFNGCEAASQGLQNLQWIEDLLKINYSSTPSLNDNILNYMDNFAVHAYCGGNAVESLETYIDSLRGLLNQYGKNSSQKNMKIWITEIGRHLDGGRTEIDVASELVKTYALCLLKGVERINWYEFMMTGGETFGTIRPKSDTQFGSYTPKAAYVSYSVMTRALRGKTGNIIKLNATNENVYKIKFGNASSGFTTVIWCKDGIANVPVSASAEVINIMGATISHPGPTLPIGADPVFVNTTN